MKNKVTYDSAINHLNNLDRRLSYLHTLLKQNTNEINRVIEIMNESNAKNSIVPVKIPLTASQEWKLEICKKKINIY
jgi:hypothetical protein